MSPLEGILVVAVEQAVAAPLCTARLVDAGARVIKIERPGGDFARKYDTSGKGDSSYFVWINQGKESVVLDFKDPEDKRLLHALIAKADVFIQNLAPGAIDRAGFGSDDLRKLHPRLITCDISGYGDAPEVANMKAYDFLVQGESGLVSVSGGPNELGRIGVSVCDIGAGLTAHAGILEALLLRANTGKGSAVRTSLFDVAAEWMTVPLLHYEHGSGAPERQGLQHPSIAPYGAYRTNEGTDTILSIQNEREWVRFCAEVLRDAELAVEPQFSSNNIRVENRDALDAKINSTVSELSAQQFRLRLEAASIAYGGLNSVEDLSNHAALRRREAYTSEGLDIRLPDSPINTGERPVRAVPKLGESTDAVRAEFLVEGSKE